MPHNIIIINFRHPTKIGREEKIPENIIKPKRDLKHHLLQHSSSFIKRLETKMGICPKQ